MPVPLMPHLAELSIRFRYDPATGRIFHAGKGSRTHMGKAEIGTHADTATDTQGYRMLSLAPHVARPSAHRVAWLLHYREEPPDVIDHVNGKPADNRIANLRAVTMSENSRNAWKRKTTRAKNTTGISGLTIHRNNRRVRSWIAALITTQGHRASKSFNCPALAVCWLDEQRRKNGYSPRHGEPRQKISAARKP